MPRDLMLAPLKMCMPPKCWVQLKGWPTQLRRGTLYSGSTFVKMLIKFHPGRGNLGLASFGLALALALALAV